jgi:hypothetical protein
MVALTLLAGLVAGAPARCFLVTNHRIVILTTCDFSPSSVDEIAREVDPPGTRTASPDPSTRGVPILARYGRDDSVASWRSGQRR